MKLIFAIVNKDDSNTVSSVLTQEGFAVTRLATTGGFLRAGNTTLMLGTEDDRVDEAISLLEKYSKKRTQVISSPTYGGAAGHAFPMEVTVGGATVFVTDIERYEKL